jgi:hypothetical protein
MSNRVQRSFAGGEVAPELHARADLARFAIGLRACRNMVVMRAGGATKRPGTKVVDVSGTTDHYVLHTFGPGTPWVFSDAFAVSNAGNGQYRALLVGGGGSGGSVDGSGVAGGGGGAGGVLDKTNLTGLPALTVGSHAIVIGAGGPTNDADHTIGLGSVSGNQGDDTTAFGLTAFGGGKGNANDASAGGPTSNGGSGGGQRGNQEDPHVPPNGVTLALITGGTGTVGQGHDGGDAARDPTATGGENWGGGGGGAGAPGHSGIKNGGTNVTGGPPNPIPGGGDGKGGDGIQSDITGTATYYGGGGGAGNIQGFGGANGGLGGGGNGGPVHSGTDGLGGGGGGGNAAGNNNAGRGGHGQVIVRYLASSGIIATGGTITTIPI